MARHIDTLTAPTLKHLRGEWWDADFSAFLHETLRPRPGTRILDVGCGDGTAELSLGQLRVSQLSLFAVDRDVARVARTAAEGRSHNYRLRLAGGDVTRLPFVAGAFDATFCVAVLQHVGDLTRAVLELARVTRPGGRVLAVEPDNSARYWHSSSPLGSQVFAEASQFLAALRGLRGDAGDPAVGPRISGLFSSCGIEPVSIQLFPVTVTHIGPQAPAFWQSRREAVQAALRDAGSTPLAAIGWQYLQTLDRYAQDAARLGAGFVEIQNTMLVATVGQLSTEGAARKSA